MAALTVYQPGLSGVAVTFVAASAGGDTFVNDGAVALVVKNGSAGALSVVVNSSQPCDQGFDHDVTVSVPAGEERTIGPFNTYRFGTTVSVTYPGGVTSLTVAAVKVR